MTKINIIKQSKKIILLMGILLVVVWFRYNVSGSFEKLFLDKKEQFIVQILSKDQIEDISHKQGKLADEIELKKGTNNWLSNEIRKGKLEIFDNYHFLRNHPEYDLIEVKLPITIYILKDGQLIEFFSGKGEITQVHSINGWESYIN